MSQPYDFGRPRPRSHKVNFLQHQLQPGCALQPCRDCGSDKAPHIGKPLGLRRVVRCLGCGGFFVVLAGLTDAEIAERWNARERQP